MKEQVKNIPPIQLYHLLWKESELAEPPSKIQDCVAGINLARAKTRRPLLSSMSSFNPTIPQYTITPADTEVARSLWQQGLIRFIKTQGVEGRDSMISACQRLHSLPDDHLVRMTGYCLTRLLMLSNAPSEFNTLLSCLMEFEQALCFMKSGIKIVPTENLLRNVLFYIDRLSPASMGCIEDTFKLSLAWHEDRPLQGLQERIGYYAKRIMRTLAAPDSDTTIKRDLILPDLTPVLDGILFLKWLPLRAQIEARHKKCPSQLLLISVPAQKLMAEFMRLAVYDKSPN